MPITINGSTGISGVDGSSSTPALIGSDADTGIFVSAGRVQASLNGTAANVGLVQGTAQNSTSGTFIDFTGIPSWAKRVTVMFQGVSTSGTSPLLLQLGISTGPVTSGYLGGVSNQTGTVTSFSAGHQLDLAHAAADVMHGTCQIFLLNSNTWCTNSSLAQSNAAATRYGAGSVSLSGTLDRVRITTVNGTDTFDAGSINILYE